MGSRPRSTLGGCLRTTELQTLLKQSARFQDALAQAGPGGPVSWAAQTALCWARASHGGIRALPARRSTVT